VRRETRDAVRRVIHHQIYDHPNAPLLRSVSEFHEIADRAVSGVDAVIVGDVVTVVLTRRRLKGHQPYRGYSEPVQVIQPSHQPWEITDPVGVRVHIGSDREAIDDRILVPKVVYHSDAIAEL
jgi:hypothetical protein